jgi:hypothetical protein
VRFDVWLTKMGLENFGLELDICKMEIECGQEIE